MSDLTQHTLERLEGYEILPSPAGTDAFGLILWTKSERFQCVAGQSALLRLAASIQKHVGNTEHSD